MDIRERVKNLWYKINDYYARYTKGKNPVSEEDFLYRRISPEWQKVDGTISSAAFEHFDLSVDLASLTTVKKSWKRAGDKHFGLAELSVRDMRTLPLAQEVRHWPEIFNYSHSLVSGEKKKRGNMMRKIRDKARVIIHTAKFRSGPPTFSSRD